jgi:hypothetical protein
MFLIFPNFTISNLVYSRTKIALRTLRIMTGSLHQMLNPRRRSVF